jgi:hypothetical protein
MSVEPLIEPPTNINSILFSTNKKDKEHYRVKGNPIAIIGTNIPSLMGGRANPWDKDKNRLGVQNPYASKDDTPAHRKLNFHH